MLVIVSSETSEMCDSSAFQKYLHDDFPGPERRYCDGKFESVKRVLNNHPVLKGLPIIHRAIAVLFNTDCNIRAHIQLPEMENDSA